MPYILTLSIPLLGLVITVTITWQIIFAIMIVMVLAFLGGGLLDSVKGYNQSYTGRIHQ